MLRWCVVCLALSACGNPAKDRYDTSLDCAVNDYARHIYVDQTTNPQEMLDADRKIWEILTAGAERDGRAFDIPAERVHQEIVKRGGALQRDLEAGKFGKLTDAATGVFEKAHRCLRHSSGGAAAEALLDAKQGG